MINFLQTVLIEPQPGFMQQYSFIIMIGLMVLVLWLFMWRPEAKSRKQLQEFRVGLKRGDIVIAAGGIADGRGVAAAVLLGACGVQMGTRFLSAEECSSHPVYKERILKANDLSTMVTGKRLGHPVRSLRTNIARSYSPADFGGLVDKA